MNLKDPVRIPSVPKVPTLQLHGPVQLRSHGETGPGSDWEPFLEHFGTLKPWWFLPTFFERKIYIGNYGNIHE